jgi:hypothetical protein
MKILNSHSALTSRVGTEVVARLQLAHANIDGDVATPLPICTARRAVERAYASPRDFALSADRNRVGQRESDR